MFGDLQQGSSGNEVVQLQQSLTALGYDVGVNGTDGIFGTDTASAVRAFQRDAGITVDGIAGIETLTAMGRELAGGPVTTTNAPGDAKPAVVGPAAPVAVQSSILPAWGWLALIGGGLYYWFFMRKKGSSGGKTRHGKSVRRRIKVQ